MDLTIITINYNNRAGLARTLESVRNQDIRGFQYVVVDGGSTDGSVDLINEYQDIITDWVSERDNGIYNAMNKGVAMAMRSHCLFLNSGDVLHAPDVIRQVKHHGLDRDIVFGRVVNVFPGNKDRLYIPEEEMSLLLIIQTGIHHAGSFISTKLMQKYHYDETLKICSDRKFFIEALVIDNCSMKTIPVTVCDFEMGGVSNTSPLKLIADEKSRIMNSLFPPRIIYDYNRTNVRIQKMTARLVRSREKIISLVCKADEAFLSLCRLVLGHRAGR